MLMRTPFSRRCERRAGVFADAARDQSTIRCSPPAVHPAFQLTEENWRAISSASHGLFVMRRLAAQTTSAHAAEAAPATLEPVHPAVANTVVVVVAPSADPRE